MKTGNGHSPNPKGIFGKQGKQETSNIVGKKLPVTFNAKQGNKSTKSKR